MGYLVNHPGGLAGSQGIGYDYVLGAGGIYVQSESVHLTARILVAPAQVRGLSPVSEKVEMAHGPILARVFELGLAWMLAAPGTERFFAIRWDGDAYRPVVPPQEGTGLSLSYQPPAEWSPSSIPTDTTGPSSRPPTMETSKGSESTASWDAWTRPPRN